MVETLLTSVADDQAVVDGDDPLAKLINQVLGVGNHQHGGAQIVDLLQQLHDFQRLGRVQVAGGLVSDDGRRIVDQCPGDGKTLQYLHDERALIPTSKDRNVITSCINNIQNNRQIQNLLKPIDVWGDEILTFNEDAFFINFTGIHNDETCDLKFKMKADN